MGCEQLRVEEVEVFECVLGWRLQALTCATHGGADERDWTGWVFHAWVRCLEFDALDWQHSRQGGLIVHVALEDRCKNDMSDWHWQ